MADFSEHLRSFVCPGMDYMNQFTELNTNPNVMESSTSNLYMSLMGLSDHESFLTQQSDFNNSFDAFSGTCRGDCCLTSQPMSHSMASKEEANQYKKRKVRTPSESSSGVSSAPGSDTGSGLDDKCKRKNITGRGKRKFCNGKQVEKLKEVIHVRAKRGQATDSHSLAERVRREKINERMRCLQDLVPGCYKTMGMAVMLDEIINYVQSLQNQVEFLSMKLSAASSYYDFSFDMETPQVTNAYEALELERLVREGYGGSVTSFHSTLPL